MSRVRISNAQVRRTMRRLYAIAQDPARPTYKRDEAYAMASALQWSLGGCTWTPTSLLEENSNG
jgi:hypothetical protein